MRVRFGYTQPDGRKRLTRSGVFACLLIGGALGTRASGESVNHSIALGFVFSGLMTLLMWRRLRPTDSEQDGEV